MRKINCVIIDDEPCASDILSCYINKTPDFEIIGNYYDPIKALDGLRSKSIDVIFCDIEMPDINGLQLLESLSLHQNQKALIVIVSAHSKYAIDGFNINAIDYLLKPVSFARYMKTVQKIQLSLKKQSFTLKDQGQTPQVQSSEDYFFIKSNNKLLKINYNEILYIEGFGDYVKIHFDNDLNKPHLILASLKHLEETLPNNLFKRIHRSYIVAISKIKAIEYKKAIIREGLSLPISNSYYDNLLSNNIMIIK
jgi:DNA-binding LytR/AlgR family response regulator